MSAVIIDYMVDNEPHQERVNNAWELGVWLQTMKGIASYIRLYPAGKSRAALVVQNRAIECTPIKSRLQLL